MMNQSDLLPEEIARRVLDSAIRYTPALDTKTPDTGPVVLEQTCYRALRVLCLGAYELACAQLLDRADQCGERLLTGGHPMSSAASVLELWDTERRPGKADVLALLDQAPREEGASLLANLVLLRAGQCLRLEDTSLTMALCQSANDLYEALAEQAGLMIRGRRSGPSSDRPSSLAAAHA